jgi:hypothetical protein
VKVSMLIVMAIGILLAAAGVDLASWLLT